MKTKIVYISGNEVFDMADIRAAFEEVRCALNLDKETVLFGVPVDVDDAGLIAKEQESTTDTTIIEDVVDSEPETQEIPAEIVSPIQDEIIDEPVIEEKPKKQRVRKSKKEDVEPELITEEPEEKIVPIMSILSAQSKDESDEPIVEQTTEIITQEIETIKKVSESESVAQEIPEETIEDIDEQEITDEDTEEEADLEKLLSAMTPLREDVLEDKKIPEIKSELDHNDDISVDATLEQLATEFAETQDKIATANKSSSRSKIGKLRNILPFKQSKHKDQGLGDLFGWAGIAANDEDFSVPGFFTNAASKK